MGGFGFFQIFTGINVVKDIQQRKGLRIGIKLKVEDSNVI